MDGDSARVELRDFVAANGIRLMQCDVGSNQEPFEVMKIDIVSDVVRKAIG